MIVLVTGAGSGIGTATALELSRRGHELLLTSRDGAALAAVSSGIGARCHPADLARPEQVEALADWALAAGPPQVVVLNAGVGWLGPLQGMPGERSADLIAVNLHAPIRLTARLLGPMLERSTGHVVLLSSIAGCLGVRHEAAYSATKAGLRAFADSLRWELAGTGVAVSVVVPGVVATPFFDRRGAGYPRERPRPLPPQRVAVAVADLLDRPAAEVFVPRWLRLPARLHGAFPGLTGALARRFG